MRSIILGLNAFHGDAAACVLVDGQLVAAAEEERFRRVKHWAGFPAEAVRYCLDEAGAHIAEVSHVAVNSAPRAALARKAWHVLRHWPDPALIADRLRNAGKRASVEEHLRVAAGDGFRGQVHRIEHHAAHLASAYFASGWDDALALSVDGFGDFASAAWGRWTHRRRSVTGRVWFPHSLGVFYQAMTQYLGFPKYGDEYKVMGLAAHAGGVAEPGPERLIREVTADGFRLDLRFFRHHRERIAYRWDGGEPSVGRLYSDALVELLGTPRAPGQPVEERHKRLAQATQQAYEKVLFTLLGAIHQRVGGSRLVLAGGCAMNSLANGRIARETPYAQLYVQAAAGDAGGAFGAAASVQASLGGELGGLRMTHAALGPGATPAMVREALAGARARLEEAGCVTTEAPDTERLVNETAAAIAAGEVVGWFQGRMEWGPRALGNRSILADPRRADMREVLNRKIKLREPFRPFAPSVLVEQAGDWFDHAVPVPFMSQVLPVRPERRAAVPAITHADGTGRLQTVSAEEQPLYHRLISAFADITGVPMVLNTSFNENEPIVRTPAEALDCFLRTRMDRLVMGDVVVRRAAAP